MSTYLKNTIGTKGNTVKYDKIFHIVIIEHPCLLTLFFKKYTQGPGQIAQLTRVSLSYAKVVGSLSGQGTCIE